MALLQTQDTAGFKAIGNQPVILARVQNGLPECGRVARRTMQLETQLTGKADPHGADGDAGQMPLATLKVGEGVR